MPAVELNGDTHKILFLWHNGTILGSEAAIQVQGGSDQVGWARVHLGDEAASREEGLRRVFSFPIVGDPAITEEAVQRDVDGAAQRPRR